MMKPTPGLLILLILATVAQWCAADDGIASGDVSKTTQVLGKEIGFNLESEQSQEATIVSSSLSGTALGKPHSLVSMEVTADPEWVEGRAEFYAKGLQLASIQIPLKIGALKRKVLLPTLQINAGVLPAPIGPLLVQLKAGIVFQGSLEASLVPVVSYPVTESSLVVKFSSVIDSSAFLEGSATFILVRGRIRGELTLANVDVAQTYYFYANGAPTFQNSSGQVEFFSGGVTAYLDLYNFFRFKWKKVWSDNIYAWDGSCYDLKTKQQIDGACRG